MKPLLLTLALTASSCAGLFAENALVRIDTTALINKTKMPVSSVILMPGATGTIEVESQKSDSPVKALVISPTLTFDGTKVTYMLAFTISSSATTVSEVRFSGETDKGKTVRFQTTLDGKAYDVSMTFSPITPEGKEI